MIEVTVSAKSFLFKALEDRTEEWNVRIGVQGAGCSGYQYVIEFSNIEEDGDYKVDVGEGRKLLVDPMSMTLMTGATVDITTDGIQPMLQITNPNATNTCGCGHSFSA